MTSKLSTQERIVGELSVGESRIMAKVYEKSGTLMLGLEEIPRTPIINLPMERVPDFIQFLENLVTEFDSTR